MKNNKGFTLLELLAIIMLLGVIMLIAIPSINSIMLQAKVGANKTTGNNYVDTVKSDCEIKMINGESYEGTYHLSDLATNITGGNNVKGKVTVGKNCKVELVMEADNTNDYCYVKSFEDDTVKYYRNKDGLSCSPEEITKSEESCFDYVEENGKITITNFKCGGQISEMLEIQLDENNMPATRIVSHTNGSVMNVVIPAYIDNKPVTKIGPGAFSIITGYNETTREYTLDATKPVIVNSVKIPSTVKEIGVGAFAHNALTSVDLSEGIETIGATAFVANKINGHLFLPNSLTSIDVAAFMLNDIKSVSIGNKLNTLSSSLFYNNKITSVTIPSNIVEIGSMVFAKNKITGTLVIPSTVQLLYGHDFCENDISKVIFEGGNPVIWESIFEINLAKNSNTKLTQVVNKTGRVYDWQYILYNEYDNSTPDFETGTVTRDITTVITK